MSLSDYFINKLNEIYTNLLLTDEATQKRYAVQYCNSDNAAVKLLACDILYHYDIIEFKNKKLLELMINGDINSIEELMK